MYPIHTAADTTAANAIWGIQQMVPPQLQPGMVFIQ